MTNSLTAWPESGGGQRKKERLVLVDTSHCWPLRYAILYRMALSLGGMRFRLDITGVSMSADPGMHRPPGNTCAKLLVRRWGRQLLAAHREVGP